MMDKLALILLIVGGLNWGSIGIFQFDIVSWIFGGQTSIGSRIVYTIVALAAIWCISLLFKESDELVSQTP
ncbi:MAG: DUF378 domain-containing protein [Clostridia bacterium]|nr:DUF378 domain-containing protein [Clostridia bacterium]